MQTDSKDFAATTSVQNTLKQYTLSMTPLSKARRVKPTAMSSQSISAIA
jgi:hypothetical protein